MTILKRRISTPIGILIIVLATALVGGIFAWQWFGISKEKTTDETAKLVPSEVEGWKTYRNEEQGFEIKYPKSSQCKFSETGNGAFYFGRIELGVADSKGLDLVNYVDSFISNNDWVIETKENTITADSESIKLMYRFGGTNRYGEVTFVKNNENIYAIGFTAGGFTCDEPQIFPQILSTFRFLE